jgi:hypothetical protein
MKVTPLITAVFLLAFLSVRLHAQPVIHSFSPTSGTVGSTVVISGSGFSSVPSENIVYFGSVSATVSTATTSSLTVTVPKGSSYKPITVTTNRLTGSSAQPFVAIFNGIHNLTPASFAAKTDFPSGYWVEDAVVADLDNDGKPDLLNINSSGIISVFRNTSSNGRLSLAPRSDITTDQFPHSLSVTDLDGDGKLDLVVNTSKHISLYKNSSVDSSISFNNKVNIVVGNVNPVCLTVSDFDVDGKPDIAIASWDSVYLLRNTTSASTLTFAPAAAFDGNITSVISMSSGDLDGDRKADIALVDYTASAVTLLKNSSTPGKMVFSAASTLNVQVRHVAFADFNADGKNEMAMAAIGANMIYLYRNTGNPGTISFAGKIDLPVDQGPIFCATGDLNGDGKPDIISLNANTVDFPNVSVLTNTGTGGTISFAPRVELSTGSSPRVAVIADLDEDQLPDLTVAAYQPGTFSVLKSKINDTAQCTGNFKASVITRNADCGGPYAVGVVTFRSTGGNGAVQYSLDGSTFSTDSAHTVSIGSHMVTAMDSKGCTSSVGFNIKQDSSLMNINAAFNELACGDTAGTKVTLTVTGGLLPYSYSLYKETDSLVLTYQRSNVFNNIKAGRYKIQVVDSNQCTKETFITVKYSEPKLVTVKAVQVCAPASVDLTNDSITRGSDPGLVLTYWSDTAASRSVTNPAAVTVSGTYFIKATASGGCFSVKPVVVRIIVTPQKPVITTSGVLNVCMGDSVVLASNATGKNQWYRDDVIINGATGRNYTAKLTGAYKVITETECGVSSSSVVNVIVNSLPPVPVITVSDSLLSSSQSSGNQWYLDGKIIPGATSQHLKATIPGSYTVKVTQGGCSNISVGMPWPGGTLVCPQSVTVATNKDCAAMVNNIDASISPGSSLAFLAYHVSGATSLTGVGTASGQTFKFGTSTVKYFLQNDTVKHCSFNVTVKDTLKSNIDSIIATPASLWPADHRMVDVTLNYGTKSGCATASCIVTVSSNEADSGLGAGDLDKDWQIIDEHRVRLRAESFSTGGRIYTLKVTCTDSLGNKLVRTAAVRVPKNALEIVTGPNPTTDQFIIHTKSVDDQPLMIRVMDAFGNLVELRRDVPPNTTVYIGRNYAPGIYYIEISQGNIRQVLRLVKLGI